MSASTASPPCLELHIDTSEEAAGGCVNPVIIGTNRCADTLSFSAAISADETELSFAKDQAVAIQIDLDNGSLDDNDGITSWNVPATLGDATLVLSFQTWRE